MIAVLNQKQTIYEVYKTLSGPVTEFEEVQQLASDNLFRALSVFVGESIPNTALVNVPRDINYDATPSQQINIERMIGSVLAVNNDKSTDFAQLSEIVSIKLMVFYYNVDDLLEEVMKRTTYIAKSRLQKEDAARIFDIIRMTRDDMSIFTPILRDAFSKTFESLIAFTRQVANAYLYKHNSGIGEFVPDKLYLKGDKIAFNEMPYKCNENTYKAKTLDLASWQQDESYLYTDNKIEYVILSKEWINTNILPAADTSIFEAIIDYVMYKWFTIVWPTEAKFYFESFSNNRSEIVYLLNSANRVMNRKYRMF